MANFKISKKEVLSDKRYTIQGLHEEKLAEIASNKENIDTFKKKLSQMAQKIELASTNNLVVWQDREKYRKLQLKIEEIEADQELINYLLQVAPILGQLDNIRTGNNDYIYDSIAAIPKTLVEIQPSGQLDSFIESVPNDAKSKLYRQYIETFRPDLESTLPHLPKGHNIDMCCHCHSVNTVFDQKSSTLSCLDCSICEHVIDSGTLEAFGVDMAPKWDEHEQVTQFAYKRINHFQECLSQFQAKEATEIPKIIITELTKELKKYNIDDPKLITPLLIKGYLKKLNYNKYYEHIPSIINNLCGLPPPKMTKELEDQLRVMFEEIQEPFNKYCPKNRKNFLSYNYVLHKMCQLLNQDHFLNCFPLLKSREKLYQQDNIWKGICKDLRWEFIVSL